MKTFEDLDSLMARFQTGGCVISMQPEPHLVQAWAKGIHHGRVFAATLLNDGISKPEWPKWERRVTVDRTFLLNSAFEEILNRRWWLPRDAAAIDGGEFYAQLKAPSRIRDISTGELEYRWTETGALDHFRFVHAFDHLYGVFRGTIGVVSFI